MRTLVSTLLLTLGVAVSGAVLAEDRGLEIAKAQDARNNGFRDNVSDMTMTLRNATGNETVRNLRAYTLEVANDGDKTKLVFDRPADIKGTAMLTYSHGLQGDDQWLFLPATKRVKRLNSQNRSGPFLGSEFAYEDLSAPVVEKFSYKYLRDEKCGELNCHVIERTPLYENSGYTKQITWIDAKELRTMKTEFYDRKHSLMKTLQNSAFKLFEEKYWRAEKSVMINLQTGKSTELLTSNTKFGIGLAVKDFEPAALEH